MQHRHLGGGGWPWRCHATQRFVLMPNPMALTLSLTNDAEEACPAGLGPHPYFPGDRDTMLRARSWRVWLADAINRGGMDVLLPGETLPLEMAIAVMPSQ